MSLDRGNIAFEFDTELRFSEWHRFIELLEGIGRITNYNGTGSFISVGNNDFDWSIEQCSKNSLLDIIKVKCIEKELIGFHLYKIGDGVNNVITVLSGKPNEIVMALPDDASAISNTVISDFSTYLTEFGNLLFPSFGPFGVICSQYLDRQ